MRLKARFEQMTPAERVALAEKVGINPGYLWQIATRWMGRRPSLEVMARLAKADRKLSVKDMVAEFTKDE